jgi:hypothetical protein
MQSIGLNRPLCIRHGCRRWRCEDSLSYGFVATSIIFGSPWHLHLLRYQAVDGWIEVVLFEEDQMGSGEAISHAHDESRRFQ